MLFSKATKQKIGTEIVSEKLNQIINMLFFKATKLIIGNYPWDSKSS